MSGPWVCLWGSVQPNLVLVLVPGELGFLQGSELQRELDCLCYRERRTFCLQATVSMVTYSHRGQVRRTPAVLSQNRTSSS